MKKTPLLCLFLSGAAFGQIEPSAGNWKTWVVSSGRELRLEPPPDRAATRGELQDLKLTIAQAPENVGMQVEYWNAGSPGYRWLQVLLNRLTTQSLGTPRNTRAVALLNVAIYDATIAAWDTKYEYNRPRPAVHDRTLKTMIATPASPSYPSEHAAAAGAAAAILGYLFPADAQTYANMAQQAASSRLFAGVQYPSDVIAGLKLGRDAAAKVITWAKADGSDMVWTGTVPTGPCRWTGTNPAEPLAGLWKTWAISSGSQFRPPAPPACDSTQEKAELSEITSFTHTFNSDEKAMFWQSTDGFTYWYDFANRQIFEHGLHLNPPRAARVYALASIAHYDSVVAFWGGKDAYWAIRPVQLDKTVVTLFTTPNHPSYPAAHGCSSGGIARTLAMLFPSDAVFIDGKASEAGESRTWAGIHFRSDVSAGLAIGRSVAATVSSRAAEDGAGGTAAYR